MTIPATNGDNSYPGGKGNLYQQIISLIPPHRVYIECFVGGGAVLRNKRPAPANIAIDRDASALANLRWSIAANGKYDCTIDFVHADAVRWLSQYQFAGDEFIYADPPYLMSTRRQHRQLYLFEMGSVDEHNRLLDILTAVPCRVMLSGYWSDLYKQRLADWHIAKFRVKTRGGSWATEYLWMNYPRPVELHDYQHLGRNYRERERIKRKKARWVEKWSKMPILERQAILAAIQESNTL